MKFEKGGYHFIVRIRIKPYPVLYVNVVYDWNSPIKGVNKVIIEMAQRVYVVC